MIVWQKAVIAGLAAIGAVALCIQIVRWFRWSLRKRAARRLLARGGNAGAFSKLLHVTQLLAANPDHLSAMADFVVANKIAGEEAAMVLEVALGATAVTKERMLAVSYLARLYVESRRYEAARRLLDYLIEHEKTANDNDLALRARMAVEDMEASRYSVAVCERAYYASVADQGLQMRLGTFLAEYYSAAILTTVPTDPDAVSLGARALKLFELLCDQDATEPCYHSNIVLAHFLRGEHEECQRRALRAREIFGGAILDDIAVAWARSLLETFEASGFDVRTIPETAQRAGLHKEEMLRIFEKAYRDGGAGECLGPLASLCASGDRRDEIALATYAEAHRTKVAHVDVLATYFQQLIQYERWADAIPVGETLLDKVPDELQWAVLLTQCLIRADQGFSDEHLAIAHRSFTSICDDPACREAMFAALGRRKSWDSADQQTAAALEPLCSDGEQARSLRERILGQEDMDPSTRIAAFRRWWQYGGRTLAVVEPAALELAREDPYNTLLPELGEWLYEQGRVLSRVCSAQFRQHRLTTDRKINAEQVRQALETLWEEREAFTADDVDALLEMCKAGLTPSAPSYKKGILALLENNDVGTAAALCREFLDAGYFDRPMLTQMLAVVEKSRSSDLAEVILWSLFRNRTEVFASATRLLRIRPITEMSDTVLAELRVGLVEAFFEERVSDRDRSDAWDLVESYLIDRCEGGLSGLEQDIVLFGLDHSLIPLESEKYQAECRSLCATLLGAESAKGLRLAMHLAESNLLGAELALEALKVAKK